jgi:glycerophosphoryl diester phosphodiesterase
MKKIIFLLFISIKMTAQSFDLQGHRGCRGLMPENTIEAFMEALKYKVTTLELDVSITKDSQVVVSHEPYMNSLFCINPDGTPVTKAMEKSLNLYQMNYNEIKQFDTGSRGNIKFPEQKKISTFKPLLRDVFIKVEAFLKANNYALVNYNIEIKSEASEYGISQPSVEEFSDLVYAEIMQYIDPKRVVLQSFDFNVLKFWHKKFENNQYKKVRLAALVEQSGVKSTFETLGFLPDIYSPYFKLLTKGQVKKCQKKGVQVIPWTVNEPNDMIKIKDMRVDGLITDYPDRAKKLLE